MGAHMNPMKAKLLIVDDNATMRGLLCELMNDLNVVSIDEAADGLAAITLFQKNQYDLVISDWNMPHISGLELLRAIRHSSARNHTPVVLISGEMNALRVAEALEAGATNVLEKPFSVAKLCDRVQAIIASLSPVADYRHTVQTHEHRI
jgi:two-component system, chemotaxis family, chemotaxis protein CheY